MGFSNIYMDNERSRYSTSMLISNSVSRHCVTAVTTTNVTIPMV